ncbi:MAG TPA: patatin-like phospholipase family protein [Bradyrhizobium sp.]|nr:patatin-like phospholipase family protein [Bradyrhizobium sp.]
MTDPLPASPGGVAQQADDFNWDGHTLEPGIAIALSGGGFRAMLFHAGALMRLNELGVLSRVARISSVSGGSISSGFLACVWKQLGTPDAGGAFAQFQQKYVEPILAFSREKIDIGDILTGMLPWTSAAEQVAASYDKALFSNVTLQDIPDQPRFVFCATNLQTGVLFRFSKPYAGDYVMGRLDKPNLPLSTAVTASSAFPPFLSPLALTLPAGSFTDWPGQPRGGNDPLPFRARVLLSDGGVYDNHGLEPIVKRYMTVLVSDGGAPFGRIPEIATDPIRQLQRVFDVTDGQVRALRRRDLINRFYLAKKANLQPVQVDPDARLGCYWGIETDPSKLAAAGALPTDAATVTRLAHLATRLSDLGSKESRQLVNWGYAICDRSIRTHYNVAEIQQKPAPTWPYRDAALG